MLDRAAFGWSGPIVIHVMLFTLLLAGCCGYAFIAGGAPERIVAGMMIGAMMLTILCQRAPTYQNYQTVEIGVMFVDIALLCGLLLLSVFSVRYWPLWLSGLQIVQVAAHVGRIVDPRLLPLAYALVLAFWSYPMVAMLAIGTFRHRRRLARIGEDPAWRRRSAKSGGAGFPEAAAG